MTASAFRDLLARAGWVTIYAVLGFAIQQLTDISNEWLMLLLPGFSLIKSGIGTQVGDPGDARLTSKAKLGVREDGLIFGDGPHFGGE